MDKWHVNIYFNVIDISIGILPYLFHMLHVASCQILALVSIRINPYSTPKRLVAVLSEYD